jgi:hypothetical protein
MRATLSSTPRTARAAVVAVAALSAVGLSACGGDTAGTEAGADVEDVVEEEPAEEEPAEEEPLEDGPYEGVYDTAFYDGVDTYVGEEVVLSADVNEVITPESFTIAGTDDTSVEALLVVGATGDTELAPETTVGVTGTVQEAFVVTEVEEELGVDLDDALFAEWEQEPYVVADDVEVLENAEG